MNPVSIRINYESSVHHIMNPVSITFLRSLASQTLDPTSRSPRVRSKRGRNETSETDYT